MPWTKRRRLEGGDIMPGRTRVSRAVTAVYFFGDGLFLVVVSVTATVVMHMVHKAGWGFLPECATGMILAMLVGMLMALAAAPLLGSIESMAPSMVASMLSPMAVCVLHLLGWKPAEEVCIALGVVFGVGMFAFVQVYGAHCRAIFRRGRAGPGGVR